MLLCLSPTSATWRVGTGPGISTRVSITTMSYRKPWVGWPSQTLMGLAEDQREHGSKSSIPISNSTPWQRQTPLSWLHFTWTEKLTTGGTTDWWHWVNTIHSYGEFTQKLMERFDRKDPEIHFRELAQLKQTGSAESFISEFQRLAIMVTDVSKSRLTVIHWGPHRDTTGMGESLQTPQSTGCY